MDTEALIRQMLGTLLPRISRRVVVFLGGGTPNEAYVAGVLGDYPLHCYSLVISEDRAYKALDERLLSRLSGKRISSPEDIEEALRDAELVLLPLVTRGVLSKIALGIADDPLTSGIASAIMLGKEIVAVRDGYDPFHRVQAASGMARNAVYNEMILGHEQSLKSFGVKVIDLEEFRGTLTGSVQLLEPKAAGIPPGGPNARPIEASVLNSILTLGDVQHVHEGLLRVPQGAVITPLARELLESRRVQIRFMEA